MPDPPQPLSLGVEGPKRQNISAATADISIQNKLDDAQLGHRPRKSRNCLGVRGTYLFPAFPIPISRTVQHSLVLERLHLCQHCGKGLLGSFEGSLLLGQGVLQGTGVGWATANRTGVLSVTTNWALQGTGPDKAFYPCISHIVYTLHFMRPCH